MEWKVELIKHVFWEHDAEQILGVKLPSKPREDVLAWHHDRKGLFSVKSAYRLAMALDEEEKGGRQSSSTNSCERSCWKAFWKIPTRFLFLDGEPSTMAWQLRATKIGEG